MKSKVAFLVLLLVSSFYLNGQETTKINPTFMDILEQSKGNYYEVIKSVEESNRSGYADLSESDKKRYNRMRAFWDYRIIELGIY